jgi:hypothetical protein
MSAYAKTHTAHKQSAYSGNEVDNVYDIPQQVRSEWEILCAASINKIPASRSWLVATHMKLKKDGTLQQVPSD